MARPAPPLALLAAVVVAAPAHAAVSPGTYTGTVEGLERTATITRSTCTVPASLGTDDVRTRRGLCFAFSPSASYDVRCVNDGEVEETSQRIVDGLRVPPSGKVDVMQRTVGRVAGVKQRSISRTTVKLRVGKRAITGSASYTSDLHNLAGHTECAGRVRFELQRAG